MSLLFAIISQIKYASFKPRLETVLKGLSTTIPGSEFEPAANEKIIVAGITKVGGKLQLRGFTICIFSQ